MKTIMRIYVLVLLPIWLGCSDKPNKPDKPEKQPPASKTLITRAPQKVNFSTTKKTLFPDPGIVKAISYSFLDVHDYEFDSSNRGQLLTIMPNYDQYLSKSDPHPKVILTKNQTRELLSIINDPDNYSYTAAFCYSPRNCFCFYNSKDEIVGWYEVCFECARIESIPEFKRCRKGGLTDKGMARLKQFCASANITILKYEN